MSTSGVIEVRNKWPELGYTAMNVITKTGKNLVHNLGNLDNKGKCQ